MRDLTQNQYRRKLEKYGFKQCGFMGYYKLPSPFDNTSVCSLNGGSRFRDRLSYLLTEWTKMERNHPELARKLD